MRRTRAGILVNHDSIAGRERGAIEPEDSA
jgi:hypothetical protein